MLSTYKDRALLCIKYASRVLRVPHTGVESKALYQRAESSQRTVESKAPRFINCTPTDNPLFPKLLRSVVSVPFCYRCFLTDFFFGFSNCMPPPFLLLRATFYCCSFQYIESPYARVNIIVLSSLSLVEL